MFNLGRGFNKPEYTTLYNSFSDELAKDQSSGNKF